MKPNNPEIFIDTAIFRYTASVKLVQSAKLEEGTITSKNGKRRDAKFFVYKNDVREVKKADDSLEREKSALNNIADIARNGCINLVYSHEVNLELLFQPEVDLAFGRMLGAPCRIIHSPLLKKTHEEFKENDDSEFPFKFWDSDKDILTDNIFEKIKNEFFRLPVGCFVSRLNFRSFIVGLRETQGLKVNASELLTPFLLTIESKRFKEILRNLNIDSVREEKKNNLCLDGYHLFSAEESNCDYFLTTDKHLLNHFRSSVTEAISPTDLSVLLAK